MTARSRRLVVPDRVRRAVRILDPQPDEMILEIGSGPGVAAALVCARLATGRLLAIDRSAIAVRRTSERNADHIAAGRLTVEQCDLASFTTSPGSIDKAFAVNVNLFWVADPTKELTVLRNALRPGGILHVLYGTAGPTTAERVTGVVSTALREHGFADVTVVTADEGVGVTARASAPTGARR